MLYASLPECAARLPDKLAAMADNPDSVNPDRTSTEWQDCRPGGVTEKAGRGDADTTDATLHADGRMVATVYDRRRLRRAKPAL